MKFFKDTQILTAAALVVSATVTASNAHAGALFDALPRCDAPMTVYHVRDGLDAAGPVPVIDIVDVREMSGQSDIQRRCRGTAITDSDRRPVTFDIGWHDPVNGIPYFRGELEE
ncbi:MAG: hypothetical protein R3D60_08270 [Paracoccaceae bacterium]